jgi:SAM-dependent methyltransferase
VSNKQYRREMLDEIGGLFPVRVCQRMFNQDYHRNLAILDHISPILEKGSRVLDIGIGPGVVSLVLNKLGAHVTGLDTWEEYSAGYDNRSGDRHEIVERLQANGIDLLIHDAERGLPFDSDSFDIVLFLDVIEHLSDSPRLILESVRRVLRPNGYLVVTTPNVVNLRNRILFSLGKSPFVDFRNSFRSSKYFGHAREYTIGEILFMLNECGFGVLSSELSNCWQISTQIGPDHYDRAFKLNSWRQITKCAYLLATYCVPHSKYYMLVTAQKGLG